MSQNYETFYGTLSNMRAYEQQCYNFLDYFIHFSLSSQHISLRLQHSFLSLLSGLHLSVAPYFFLNFIFFYLSVFASLSLSLFFFLSLSFSLSFPVTKKAIPIWSRARQSEALLTQGQSSIFARHPPQSQFFAFCPPLLLPPMVGWIWSLIDLLGWGFVEDFEFCCCCCCCCWGFWI